MSCCGCCNNGCTAVRDIEKTGTILLVGNPNVGKSALFNRLTGADATVSNYPGTTVDYTEGKILIKNIHYTVIDVPGAYSLEARDRAEEVAVNMLGEHRDATVVIVLDATRLERGLYIALETIERGYRVVVALNMMDMARDRGISTDQKKISDLLGVPVVQTSATGGEGIKQLADMVTQARSSDVNEILARATGGR